MILIYICLLKVEILGSYCADIEQLIVLRAGNILTLIKVWVYQQFKDTHREKAPSNETPVLTKSTSMGICVVSTTSQLLIRGSYTETKFSKKESIYGQNSFVFDRSIL